jgi:phage baseplate assembly protein W
MSRSDKFTLTQKKQKLYSDFLTSFAYNKHTGYLGVVENEDSVSQSLKNYFLTNHGERFMNSNFGGNFPSMLFDNYDPGIADALKFQLTQDINQYEPRVNVIDINIAPAIEEGKLVPSSQYFDGNDLSVSVTYTTKNLYGEQTLNLTIKRVR